MIVFVCKGSRGDVQPLACVAASLKERCKVEVSFAYDFQCPSDVGEYLISHGLNVLALPSPATCLPGSVLEDGDIRSPLQLDDDAKLLLLTAELKEIVKFCSKADGIVFNLFAYEVWLVAQQLGIPSIALSTFFISRTPVQGFERKFKSTFPKLYHLLKSSTKGEMSYGEVDHWMWRLFLDDIGAAADQCGLVSVPFSSANGTFPKCLPPPTPLVYGISPHIIQRQPYWPESVQFSGTWNLDSFPYKGVSPVVKQLVEQEALYPLIYVGFGSMEKVFGKEINWKQFLEILTTVLHKQKMRAILQSNVDHKELDPSVITLFSGTVSHRWLFSKCSLVLCHGGYGTISTALRVGVPLIVCPFGFDQSFWSDQLEWLGVAKGCPHINRLKEPDLTAAILAALSDNTKSKIQEISKLLNQEDGLENVLKTVMQTFNLQS